MTDIVQSDGMKELGSSSRTDGEIELNGSLKKL